MAHKKKVVLGVSGGIDSSTCAYYLLQQGYEVEGVYFDLWKAFSDETTTQERIQTNYKNLERLSKQLHFPINIIDQKQEFYDRIVQYFINTLKRGMTPNPCMLCNQQIKFKMLFEVLNEMDADYIATGHYARTQIKRSGKAQLLKGLDESKDQSYYLALIEQNILKRVIFPLGEKGKKEIKALYRQIINPSDEIPESQDLCFLNGYDQHAFLEKYAPESINPGEIVDQNGEMLGNHMGLALYTIGQRKGLQISAQEAYFVIDKIPEQNRLVIGFESEIGRKTFCIKNPNWISGEPIYTEKQYVVKIRYRAKPVRAMVKGDINSSALKVNLKKELRDITPGQFAVLYHKDAVIAAGEIFYN